MGRGERLIKMGDSSFSAKQVYAWPRETSRCRAPFQDGGVKAYQLEMNSERLGEQGSRAFDGGS